MKQFYLVILSFLSCNLYGQVQDSLYTENNLSDFISLNDTIDLDSVNIGLETIYFGPYLPKLQILSDTTWVNDPIVYLKKNIFGNYVFRNGYRKGWYLRYSITLKEETVLYYNRRGKKIETPSIFFYDRSGRFFFNYN